MRVGIDFDNTIVSYDHVFTKAALARGWIAPDFRGLKKELRDSVRLLEDGEIKWQILQGEVYGTLIGEAVPFAGFEDFLRAAAASGFDLYIVSHKTQYSGYDPRKVDLRQAALWWLNEKGFFKPETGLSQERVFFAATREEKIQRLTELGCAVFIDDLEEVFLHPSFPKHVKRVLFNPAAEARPLDGVTLCSSWPEIGETICATAALAPDPDCSEQRKLTAIAERFTKTPVRAVTQSRKGGNNRLFRVDAESGVFALKAYFRQEGDKRDRLATEFDGLGFLRRHGVWQVPQAIAADPAEGYALYEWIDGQPVEVSARAIDAALDLIRALEKVKAAPDAAALPLASEACLCPAAILVQVEKRLAALTPAADEHADLARFLSTGFTPKLREAETAAKDIYRFLNLPFDAELPAAERCLSPSDFGFHNALVRDDGRIVFLDFEYFGWDDPLKMSCDFLLHPGMNLPAEFKQRFAAGVEDIFKSSHGFAERLRACLPLYALRWTMILLNEFLPERWQRRKNAGYTGERDVLLRLQLQKAAAMLAYAGRAGVFHGS